MQDLARMRELIARLTAADTAYYKHDAPILSDRDYDALYAELLELERRTGVTLSGSPTRSASGEVPGGSPLAFSEGGLKRRIQNVLKLRQPSRLAVTLGFALVALLSISFAVNRANTAEPTPPPSEAPLEEAPPELRLEVGAVSPAGLTYVLRNGTDYTLVYGSPYFLSVFQEGDWVALEVPENAAFTTEGRLVGRGSATRETVNWVYLYGELSPGRYRIEKTVSLRRESGETNHPLAAEFTLEAAAPPPTEVTPTESPAPEGDLRSSPQTLAALFASSLNEGVDLTGDVDAMQSWRAMFDFTRQPVQASEPRKVESYETGYTFTLSGLGADGTAREVTVGIVLRNEAPWYSCAYTYYFPYARPMVEHYLALLAEGDASKLATWRLVDWGPNPPQNDIDRAAREIEYYSDYDLTAAQVGEPMYDDAEGCFFCTVRDGGGRTFPLRLNYMDGLIFPQYPPV